uniref:Uncharacterized protein n=3 Tax=Callorhinchus milii TaxID=7868 RepID=V9KQK4_CALMI|eukprot:gi/632953455/ref/XP_007892427.1/ PREDICTED: bombesin receptor-activated protein C6orf89 homolog [Callorhinchus milii]
MGAASSEQCIYDRLADSVEVLRRSGERYGMSQGDIENFIVHILETNEPQREAPRHPRLLTAAKIVVALGLLLLTAYSFISPYGRSHYQHAVAETQNWRCPIIGHIRLFCLPIAKKYNLEGFHEWGCFGCKRTYSQLLTNCTECAALTTIGRVSDLTHISKYNHRIVQPVVIESGSTVSLSYEDLKRLHSKYKEFMDVYGAVDSEATENSYVFPEEESNLIVHWKTQHLNGMHVLRALFPNSSLLPFENKVSLKKCLITPTRGSAVQLLAHQLQVGHSWLSVGGGNLNLHIDASEQCAEKCGPFSVQLGEGDIVYANSKYWRMTISPAGEQTVIVCIGSV